MKFKKAAALLLSILLIITAIPVCVSAATFEINNGDMVCFGSYPQSKVTDEEAIEELTAAAGDKEEWESYGYYVYKSVSTCMRFTDITLESGKYRGVYLSTYRPSLTTTTSDISLTNQDDNGYYKGNVYWFRYEPLSWRVLDANNGLLMSEFIIDSQDFYPQSSSSVINGFATSAIRTMLNNSFLNTAFTEDEQALIAKTTHSNPAYITKYNSTDTTDKIYLLSYSDTQNIIYGFSSPALLQATGSDYAKAQGLSVTKATGYSSWWTRSGGNNVATVSVVGADGNLSYGIFTRSTAIGVRPVLNLDISSEKLTDCVSVMNCTGTDADCVSSGIKYYTCPGCGNYYSVTTQALGHSDKDNNTICDTCLESTVTADLALKVENEAGFSYYSKDGSAHIVKCTLTEATEITVPDTLGGCPVTTIGAYTFSDCALLEKLILSGNVTELLPYSCSACLSLTEVILPEGVTKLGEGVFSNCYALKNVTLPSTLTYIAEAAFNNCNEVESFSVADGNEEFRSDANGTVFSKKTEEVILAPTGKKQIEYYKGFDDKNLSYYMNAEEIHIAADVEEVADGAFMGCTKLKAFTVDAENKALSALNGVLYSASQVRIYSYPRAKTDKNFYIPDTVNRFTPYAFYGNYYLETIEIPSTISIIDNNCFENCTALREVTIPDSVTDIGKEVFSGDTALEKIYWNASTIKSSFKTADLFKKAGTEGEGIELRFGDNVTAIPAYLFNASGAKLLSIYGVGIATIGINAFTGCSELQEITFGESITSLGKEAFKNCSKIKKVSLGAIDSWLTASFGDSFANPLYYAKELWVNGEHYTELDIEKEEAVKISAYAFYSFCGLNSIRISSSDTVTIGSNAFTQSSVETAVIAGKSVSIGQTAFSNCPDLKSLTISAQAAINLGKMAFYNTSLVSADVKGAALTVGESCFELSSVLENFNMSDAVGTIEKKAFYGCSSLQSMRIGNGITTVGISAFEGCTVMEKIIIPVSTTKVNDNAFAGCKGLKEIYSMNAECISSDTVNNEIYKSTKIYSHAGYSVQEYAKHYGFDFEAIHIGVGDYYSSAKCTEPGEQYQKCKYCDEYANTSEVPALGHSFTNYHSDGNATCTQDGTKTAKCDRCEVTATVADEGSGGHVAGNPVAENKTGITCTSGGSYDEVVYCTRCKAELSRTVKTVEKKSHTPSTDKKVAATCTTEGLTEGSHCLVCGEVFKTQEKIPALGHDYKAVLTKPTCTAKGFTTYTCTRCKDTYKDNEIPMLDHSWDSGAVTVEPTFDEEGVRTFTCKVCRTKKTEAIAKLNKPEPRKILLGNVDNDDKVTVSDARLILRAAIKLDTFTGDKLIAADVDESGGDISVSDARRALRIAVQLDAPIEREITD